jgi:hypothetical protein
MTRKLKQYLRHPTEWALQAGDIQLRPYQAEAMEAVISSVYHSRHLEFVWIFPRQSGKDETLAVMLQYLLTFYALAGGEMVMVNPTFKPQTETSMRRLETRLISNAATRGKWKRKSGYIYQMGGAFCTYLSADPTAHIVGATANLLLLVNEAQDVGLMKFDKEISPMVASTNATTLFSGTRWTSDTLLERELQRCQAAEAQDGIKRVFFFTAEDVRKVVPAYGAYVDGQIARLGRQHPLVKTQLFCETIDAQTGMFPMSRQALMHGEHSERLTPDPGRMYAFLIDVAGQDEAASTGEAILKNPGRDSTALKVVEIEMASVPLIGKPTYLVRHRQEWIGAKHTSVFAQLRALEQVWHPTKIVIDATGVGEGLFSMLENAYGEDKVTPVKFSPQVKSELGYGFIGIIESGRYKEYAPFDEQFTVQMNKCKSEIVPGPSKLMRWGVPDGTRDQSTGELVHDDDLITGALCYELDKLEWYISSPTTWTQPRDPLLDWDHNF